MALLLLLGLLFAVDQMVRAAWYRPTYDDHGVPQALSRARLVDKGFLRFVPDRWLGTHYTPGIRLTLRTFNMISGTWSTYALRTSHRGLRGGAVEVPKLPGTLRVVAMGGSSTMGQGVQEHETYIARLGVRLAARLPGRRVEVVNAGVQGYGSNQGYRQYARDIKQLLPDLLVVAYDVNDGFSPLTARQLRDLTRPPGGGEPLSVERFPPEQARQLGLMDELSGDRWLMDRLYSSGLYLSLLYAQRWIREAVSFREGARQDGYSGPLPDPGGKGKTLRCSKKHGFAAVAAPWEPHVMWYRGNLIALDHLARRDRVPVIYLSVPVEGFQDLRAAWPYSATMKELAAARPDRRHVDPAAAFCEHLLYRVMIDYCHPTALGHDIIARALLPHAVDLVSSPKRR